MIWFYLLSGLFLGWSLGANDAANIFGTAVGTRMIKFRSAALLTSVFVILGAVISGAGASDTLGELGAVNALAGSFTVALAAGGTITWMTRLSMPVSTSQAIVGGIIGWNLYCGIPTDLTVLGKIMLTWITSPLLAALFSFLMFKIAMRVVVRLKVHLLRQDAYNRAGLLVVGAFGAYSLGANNIANVMGVFVPALHLEDIRLVEGLNFSGAQQLFLLGALAISAGVFTYSHKVMLTVGNDLFKLTPVAALVVVLSEALVLFLFASQELQQLLVRHGLPPLPLAPVSSSQAVIGGIIGIGLAKGGQGIRWNILEKIALGWVATPVIAGLASFVALFFMENVFEQPVFRAY